MSKIQRRLSFIKHSVTLLIAVVALTACATKLPEITYRYEGTVSAHLSKPVHVETNTVDATGDVERGFRMVAAGGTFIALPSNQVFDPRFNREDQLRVAQHLSEELARTQIAKPAKKESTASDEIRILLRFTKTEFRTYRRSYLIHLTVVISDGNKKLEREYVVDSSERDDSAEAWNSTAGRHKIKATKLIIERVLQDLQKFAIDA